MAWTAPRTWVAGEVVTAALLNTHIRDNLKALGDSWTSFTPSLTSTGTAPAPSSEVGAYMLAGKLCIFRFEITMSATVGTGSYAIALPTPAVSGIFPASFVLASCYDSSASLIYQRTGTTTGSATTFVLNAQDSTRVSATVPFAWAVGDIFAGYGFYEAA